MESLDELREETKILADNNIDTDELVRITEAIEREVLEGYAELPKDADGEYIHIGDRVEDNERVMRIVLTNGSWEPSVYVEKAPCLLEEYFCNEVSHYKPPTVEDVLEKALNKAASLDRPEGYWPSAADITNILDEVAPKLQLRED